MNKLYLIYEVDRRAGKANLRIVAKTDNYAEALRLKESFKPLLKVNYEMVVGDLTYRGE